MNAQEREEIIETLRRRFEENMHRHRGITWKKVLSRLDGKASALETLRLMEETGGEPDVAGLDKETGEVLFCDFSKESPNGRRSLCYDQEALASRKEHKPKTSAVALAHQLGIELLTEEQYRELQQLEELDTKTSSWVKTPPAVRRLGGALFCDRRFGMVFVYHNGAESYYAARGFRGAVRA